MNSLLDHLEWLKGEYPAAAEELASLLGQATRLELDGVAFYVPAAIGEKLRRLIGEDHVGENLPGRGPQPDDHSPAAETSQ